MPPSKAQTFNPQILDASMRDVVSVLSSEQKTDVLLYAMEKVASTPKYVRRSRHLYPPV